MRLLTMLIVASAVALSACNTVEGAGKDVKAGGQKIEDTAKEVKDKL